jgi:3-oxo-5-alpha-steroid 4-dehydrogenase 1
MGKHSVTSRFNLPGRYAWAAGEMIGPLNLLYILYSVPGKLKPQPNAASSVFGTGMPIQHELMGLLYIIHYANRALITPLFLNPSMSPIHPSITAAMSLFQFMNSSQIACSLAYSANDMGELEPSSLVSPLAILGAVLWAGGLTGNILAENKLFELRRAAARRKAKSEGKAVITYSKVYVVPPAEGFFKYILYPHYVFEWVEWAGAWILGAAWGFGWRNGYMWFLLNELGPMPPQAYSGKKWYEEKFGKKAVGGRAAAIPFLGL